MRERESKMIVICVLHQNKFMDSPKGKQEEEERAKQYMNYTRI